MSDFDRECHGEFIDGSWYGCGCEDCDEAEDDAIEADAEMGIITDAEARAAHQLNDYIRGVAE